jgi:maleamate amidohydrolase
MTEAREAHNAGSGTREAHNAGSGTREANYAGVFDGAVGFGQRPALIVVDFVNACITPGAPLHAEGVELLAAARQAAIPIVFTKVLYHPSGRDGGLFVRKVPALRALVAGEPLAEIVEALRPRPEEVVIAKQYPSPFFATPLAPMLTALGVDTVILAGCSTSGCIRAGAIDGLQYGFRVIVPRECVGDRHEGPHDANLFDIQAKYGDVMGKAEVVARLAALTP